MYVTYDNEKRQAVSTGANNDLTSPGMYLLPRQEEMIGSIPRKKWRRADNITVVEETTHHKHNVHNGIQIVGLAPQTFIDRRFHRVSRMSWLTPSAISSNFVEHLEHLDGHFQNLAASPSPSEYDRNLRFHPLEFLAYLIDHLSLTSGSKTAIMPTPLRLRKLQYFFGLVDWEGRHVPYHGQKIGLLEETSQIRKLVG